MDNKEFELFASCLAGLEGALADELKGLGVRRTRPLSGGVAFWCRSAGDAQRVCLWSRLASRVLLVVGRVDAADADALYAGVRDLPWEQVLAAGASIAVHAYGTNAELRNTKFTALKAKDGICDRMREVAGVRPDVDAACPDAAIDVRVHEGRATVSLDLSGESLHRRSYLDRSDGEDAPLACAYASGLLALSGWGETARVGGALVDPICDEGFLVTEAASVVCDQAPGLARDRWGFFGWAQFDRDVWDVLLDEADERFERGLAQAAGVAVADLEGAPDDEAGSAAQSGTADYGDAGGPSDALSAAAADSVCASASAAAPAAAPASTCVSAPVSAPAAASASAPDAASACVSAAASAPASAPDLSCVRIVGTGASSPLVARARTHLKRAGLRQAASIEFAGAEDTPAVVSRVAAVAAGMGNAIAAAAGDGAAADAADAAATGDGAAADAVAVGDIAAVATGDGAAADAADAAAGTPAAPAPGCMLVASVRSPAHSASDARAVSEAAAYLAACAAAPVRARFAIAEVEGAGISERFDAAPQVVATIGRGRIAVEARVFADPPAAPCVIMVPDNAGGAEHRVEVLEPASEQFAARLRKVARERRKWARREGVTCYHVYDADLPDYAVAIDLYEGAGKADGMTYLHIAEYQAPSSIDPAKAARRFSDVLAIAPVAMGVRPDHVFSKVRRREKGGAQYRDAGRRSYVAQVAEGGYLFEVDLSGYLDTGIFLDHRTTRALVGERARGARFLNLFAYTGTASVYAAGGGAASTVTVDLSQTYLDWAARNMELNGFSGKKHAFERADVMTWITEARRARRTFDLVFVDPPTFSNSKAMGRRTWDVQRDHAELLIGVSRLLAPEGTAVFSCNLRTFKPDTAALAKAGVVLEDITAQTIPHDFGRNPRIHQCYLVRRA